MSKDKFLLLLNKYSAVPSLTYLEDRFWKFLRKDFKENDNHTLYELNIDDKIRLAFLKSKTPSKYIWIVHLDRVPEFYSPRIPYAPEIIDHGDYVQSQLDNLVSICIMKMLYDEGVPVSILFTTREESVESFEDLLQFDMCTDMKYHYITLDIDVINNLGENDNDGITIRTRDNVGSFNKEVQEYLVGIAQKNNIPYQVDKVGFALVETAYMYRETDGAFNRGNHIGIPITHYHTNKEECKYSTIGHAYDFLYNFYKEEKNDVNSFV